MWPNFFLRHSLNEIQCEKDLKKLRSLLASKKLDVHNNFYSVYGVIVYFLSYDKIDPDIIEILLKNGAYIPPLDLRISTESEKFKYLLDHVLDQNNTKLMNLLVNADNCRGGRRDAVDYVLTRIISGYVMDESIVYLMRLGLKLTEEMLLKLSKMPRNEVGTLIVKWADNPQFLELDLKKYRKQKILEYEREERERWWWNMLHRCDSGNMVVGAFGIAYKIRD